MQLRDLIFNDEFSFNPEFRVYYYNFDTNESELLGNSSDSLNEYYEWWITAINQSDDGVIEIDIDDFN